MIALFYVSPGLLKPGSSDQYCDADSDDPEFDDDDIEEGGEEILSHIRSSAEAEAIEKQMESELGATHVWGLLNVPVKFVYHCFCDVVYCTTVTCCVPKVDGR